MFLLDQQCHLHEIRFEYYRNSREIARQSGLVGSDLTELLLFLFFIH